MEEITLSVPSVSRMVSVDVIDSTQNLARELALNGAEANTLVLAYQQTGGRGQYERTWDAKRGGIYFTLILCPRKEAASLSSLSIKTAEAVCEALKNLFGFKTKIKHPNDILVWEEKTKSWKKICGILLESSCQEGHAQWVLVGVGINVNNSLSPALSKTATSVKKLLGREEDPENILEETLECFWTKYAQWQLSGQK
ncbi:MAG: biotin--[Elusimicrobiaceae bacterium]|nr:biotin--[acetyl-CoA-carboxylase] ligase [Elusimicrobiaceae bacterium]